MKMINKFLSIFMISFMIIGNCSLVYGNANDFRSNEIILENDQKSTVEKGYPVIIATNTTDKDLDVTYNFYYSIENAQTIDKDIKIKANTSVVIEIPELKVLGKTGESRRIWFNWQNENLKKPSQNQIDTYSFKNKEKSPVELG
ncbi:MAG: hypothetical protein ACRCXT_13955 [Paraclostridium sp.]